MDKSILIIAEHFEGKVTPGVFELFGLAAQLRESTGYPVKAVAVGQDIEPVARQLASLDAESVIAVEVDQLASYNAEAYKSVLVPLAREQNPAFILLPHSANMWELAPGLATRLEAALITGVESISLENGHVLFHRAVANGKLEATVRSLAETTVLTVPRGSYKAPAPQSGPQAAIDVRKSAMEPGRAKTMGVKRHKEESAALNEADVIISAGRGVGKKENIVHVERLAQLFDNAAVAGSRPVCDSGWLKGNQQVGLTGATVTPKLYMACGISGASQHLTGMKGSEFVVAINTDANAAIFNQSDVCIVEDVNTFLPLLVSLLGDKEA